MGHGPFGGDAKEAFSHSPPHERPTFVQIDNAWADWHKHTFEKKIDRHPVLPVSHALQVHPESGCLWEEHMNRTLADPYLNF